MERACHAIHLPEEAAQAIRDGAALIREDERLSALARQFHRELFVDQTEPVNETNKRLLESDPHGAMLAAVVYMGALPQMIDIYKAKGISERVWIDTLGDMAIWMQQYYSEHGEWGLGQVGWLIRHMTGRLFQLGRFQFAFMAYNKPFKAFRNRSTGVIAVLAESGVRFRADGQADGTNGVYDSESGWLSVYDYDGGDHTGNPIANAAAVREPVRLSDREWELVLETGDNVLDVHIPASGKMTYELCRESYRTAIKFAAEFYPESPFKGFVCSSWLLAPQLPRLLPADSNIVRFQSDYNVTPVKSDEKQTLERVFGFGTKLEDLPSFPRDTSLQKTVYDYLASGGFIHGAAGFIMKESVL